MCSQSRSETLMAQPLLVLYTLHKPLWLHQDIEQAFTLYSTLGPYLVPCLPLNRKYLHISVFTELAAHPFCDKLSFGKLQKDKQGQEAARMPMGLAIILIKGEEAALS